MARESIGYGVDWARAVMNKASELDQSSRVNRFWNYTVWLSGAKMPLQLDIQLMSFRHRTILESKAHLSWKH